MQSNTFTNSNVRIGHDCFNALNDHLDMLVSRGNRSIFILCDENSRDHCLQLFKDLCPASDYAETFVITPGEEFKGMDSVMALISFMTDHRATRHSLLINLGGGVITDIGGFAANIFKRGIDFINIPTTLIGQIDASVGGKTGVNVRSIKNHVGTFHFPAEVLIYPQFLDTLTVRHIRSGLGEMVKYAMIGADISLDEIEAADFMDLNSITGIIQRCVNFKSGIVQKDPFEKGLREILNFGHTIGHAIESATMEEDEVFTHGEAVAAGIVAECFLSNRIHGFPVEDLDLVSGFYSRIFQPSAGIISTLTTDRIMEFIFHDKKNRHGRITPVLFDSNNNYVPATEITPELAEESLKYLFSIVK